MMFHQGLFSPAVAKPSADPRLNVGFLSTLGGGLAPVLVASAATNILGLGLPIVTLQVYDRVIPSAGSETLTLLVIGMVAVIVIDAVARGARARLAAWAGAKAELRLADAALDRLLRAPLGVVQSSSPGMQLDRLSAVDTVREFYANQGTTLMIDAPFAVLFLILIGVIGGWLVAVPLGLLAMFAFAAFGVGAVLRRAIKHRGDIDDRRYSFLLEVLSGIHSVKALAAEPLMVRRYERLSDSAAEAAYDTARWGGLSQAVGQSFFHLTTAGILVLGAAMVLDQRLTMGALAACTLLGGRSLQPLMRIMGLWTQFQSVRLAQDRLDAIATMPSECPEPKPPFEAISGGFRLLGVGFGYTGRERLFDGVDLVVEPGACVAITGANGSGKSTLLQIIQGVVAPDAGVVSVDGIDARTRDPESLRRQVAYLPQRPQIFRGTIMENLTMFRQGAVVREAMALSEATGLDEVVGRLPLGFDTELSDSPADILAGGARQRIAIIRALLGEARIILFDEANLVLDGPSDERLREFLSAQKGRRTMVLVSYRPSLLRLADRIYQISDRRLVPVVDHGGGPGRQAAAPATLAKPKAQVA